MRIALLAPLPPEQTGIADYAAHLRNALIELGLEVVTPSRVARTWLNSCGACKPLTGTVWIWSMPNWEVGASVSSRRLTTCVGHNHNCR